MQIKKLHRKFDRLHRIHGAEGLMSIYGAGCVTRPNVMFVFMNPTGKNVSADTQWKGIRAPWLGTKNIWKVFCALKVISHEMYEEIQRRKTDDWTPKFSDKLYKEIAENSVFITNLAKCTQTDARKLHDNVFRDYLSMMREEIKIIQPKKIITFGNQVSSILLGKPVRVSDYTSRQKECLEICGDIFDIYPVYYPVGQGMRNMTQAIQRMRVVCGDFKK